MLSCHFGCLVISEERVYAVSQSEAMATAKKIPVSVNVRLDPATRVAIGKAAKADGRTVSGLVQKLIADYLREQGLKK
jgi:hypothetical protein